MKTDHQIMLTSIPKFFSRSNKLLVGSTVQISEFDKPVDIITHSPDIETRFPFHLSAFLYEHPPNPEKAQVCHEKFRKNLHKFCGARVWTVREILLKSSEQELRQNLIDFSLIRFRLSNDINSRDLKEKTQREYIEYSLSKLSKNNLIDLILLHPMISIDVVPIHQNLRFLYDKIPLFPLANLVFCRDQQITTAKGVVIGRFGAKQRKPENILMSRVWPLLGVEPIGQIESPGTIEGGDFIPLSKDLCMLGTGLRTNFAAAKQLMEKDLIGTNRFIVVEDLVDCDQQRMHLDTYFNVVDEKLCVCLQDIARDNPRFLRNVREFVRTDKGKYEEKTKEKIPFGQWLKKEGFTVVEATNKQQEEYFINLLHLGKDKNGNNKVFTINPDVENAIRKAGFKGDVFYQDFAQITAMYGGAHCATQVLRTPFK